MIERVGELQPAVQRSLVPLPWGSPERLERLAFLTLWTTGPDPARDAPFRVQAQRRRPDGGWESFDAVANPWLVGPGEAEGGAGEPEVASARMIHEFGVRSVDLEEAPAPHVVLEDLADFLGDRPVVVDQRVRACAFVPNLDQGRDLADLVTFAAFLSPGRLASEGEDLAGILLGREGLRRRALGPRELRAALAILVGRLLASGDARLALVAHTSLELLATLGSDRRGTRELELVLQLVEFPSAWASDPDELFPEHVALIDGRLGAAAREHPALGDALAALEPAWSRLRLPREPMSPVADDPAPLDAADRRAIDEVFRDHLPRRMAPRDQEAEYRVGQHELAAQLAERFGVRELMLLHAPTGTGKTLAYLVPTLLWAVRNQVRVGVATFTRALQEQAMERDVPVALEMLARVGLANVDVRVSVLKGRRNYLCWRALEQEIPPPTAGSADLAAWLALVLFATSDDSGDLDRLATHAPLAALDRDDWRRAIRRLRRRVRASTGCCSTNKDRRTCAAMVARRRAERSHLVITNHAFAMARREFFRHIVFDECEHLHDVAHDAFSHTVTVGGMHELLGRLTRHARADSVRPKSERAALDEVLRVATAGSPVETLTLEAVGACKVATAALDSIGREIDEFKRWRSAKQSTRTESDAHSLFRLYVDSDDGAALLEKQRRLLLALVEVAKTLELLVDPLEELPAAETPRIRRSLELLRNDLEELIAGVDAWIPRRGDERGPYFGPHTFHDLETTVARDDVLAARVLLPHEHLGRHYYPDLAGAVLLSATTWLRGGFETSATYLGLARAASPHEYEDREPCALVTHRSPEPFDYGRVRVCVPRDAPTVTSDKDAFLDYVARFVGFVTERTRGRMLVLFTNADDLARVARMTEPFFAAHRIPFWHQRMEGSQKEELGELFRAHTDSVLFGLDTFWYGTDFPGATLEYLVLVRLPYGVPDRYHKAQCAALGTAEQRRQIYMPRSLAKFRQGFGRLMRRETDKGCVFLLDRRVLDPRHRSFLKELPLRNPFEEDTDGPSRQASLVSGDTDRCVDAALAHMNLKADVRRRGLESSFRDWSLRSGSAPKRRSGPSGPEIPLGDLPF